LKAQLFYTVMQRSLREGFRTIELQNRTCVNINVSKLILLLSCVLFLTSCGQSIDSSSSTIITVACFSHEMDDYLTSADGFTKIHPDIEVRLRKVDETYGMNSDGIQKLAEMADTFVWFNASIPEGARLGLLHDLQPYLASDTSDFTPALLDAFRWQDGLYALPVGYDLPVIYYDKSLFDVAAVPYPQEGWTWQDFLTTAQKLTVRQGEQVIQYGYADLSAMAPVAFVYQHGGALTSSDEGDTLLPVPSLNDPRTAEALQWYIDLALYHGVMPNPAQVGPGEIRSLIAKGQVAMWSDWVAHPTGGRKETFSTTGMVPLPGDVIEAVPIAVKGYAVSSGTRHPHASWLWIEYLSRQSDVKSVGDHWIPARSSVENNIETWADDKETAQTVRYSLARADASIGLMLSSSISNLAPVFTQDLTVEDFVMQVQSSLKARYDMVAATTPVPIAVDTPISPKKQKTIVFGILFGPGSSGNGEVYKKLARIFEATHAGIAIEVKMLDWQVNAIDAAKNSDVFLSPGWPPQECKAGLDGKVRRENCTVLVIDLSSLIQSSDSPANDFAPQRLFAVSREGKMWGLPLALDTVAVYYNKALFDRAGLAYPQADWTWNDFVTYATALTSGDGEDKQYWFASLSRRPHDMLRYYIEAQEITLLDINSAQKFFFNSPEVIQTVRWWVALDQQYGAIPPLTASISENRDLMAENRLAMWTDFIGNRSTTWRYPEDLEVGLVPLPRGERTVMEIEQQTGYISAKTKHRQECWKWLLFLSNRMPPDGKAPARLSLLEKADFRPSVGDDVADAFLAAFDAEINLNSMDGNSQFSEGYNLSNYLLNALEDISEGTTVEAALSKIQSKAESEWK